MRVAFFLNSTAGRIFCTGTLHPEASQVQGRLLIVPPLAEEMNRSRHVLAAIARAAGDAGYDVLMPDLYGTGDSAGDFADATIAIWRSDLDHVIDRMQHRSPLHIIALRAGALLAADALSRHRVQSLTLLQPQIDGAQVLTQLLRLRLAGNLLGNADKETTTQLRERLQGGEGLEIAGYMVSAALAAGLESLSFDKLPIDSVERLHWIEVAPQADRPLMPVSQRLVDAWQVSGKPVSTSVVACDQFWATQELARCPDIVSTVMRQLAG